MITEEVSMRSHIKLGRVCGVAIGLHYSWIVIAVLIATSLAGDFQSTQPEWGDAVVWGCATLTALLFFVTLVAHELAHAMVAKAQGRPVNSITLFALGGVAQIEDEPADAKSEFHMAIAGPLVSMAIGATCLGIVWGLGGLPLGASSDPVLSVLLWLGYINLSLAAFNMIPGYPLDGGRVLRSIVWWISGDAQRSTRIASRTGRVVAVMFVAGGILRFAAGGGFGALWIALIGWFLYNAAGSSYAQTRMSEILNGVRVGDLMTRDCPSVEAWTNLKAFLDDNALYSVRFCYIVTSNGQAAGLISTREVREIPPAQWMYKTVWDVMRPLDESPAIPSDAPIADALETMGRADVSQLPVAENGRIEGIISRANVLGFLEARSHMRS
jgi:Zn-dependent protease